MTGAANFISRKKGIGGRVRTFPREKKTDLWFCVIEGEQKRKGPRYRNPPPKPLEAVSAFPNPLFQQSLRPLFHFLDPVVKLFSIADFQYQHNEFAGSHCVGYAVIATSDSVNLCTYQFLGTFGVGIVCKVFYASHKLSFIALAELRG